MTGRIVSEPGPRAAECVGRVVPEGRRLRGPWPYVLAVLVVVGMRYAEPIQDGDLFWHMAYARQMLAHGTLRLDHAAFSWTPAQTDMIYCAWLSELILYFLWEHVGPWSLFALRYLVVLAVAGLGYALTRRLGLWRSPFAHLIVLLLVVASSAGTLVKAELFSLLAFNLVVHLIVYAKIAARDGPAGKRRAIRALWGVPPLVLLWANLHGAFVVGAPLLLAILAGEALNRVLAPGLALPPRVLRHLIASWAAAGLATVATPYGIAYPWQLFGDLVLGWRARPDAGWNVAYLPLWQRLGAPPYLQETGAVLLGALVLLLAVRAARAPRGARLDWTIVLATAAYVPLFLVWARTTQFLPAVVAPSILLLLADVRALGTERPAWTRAPALREVAAAVFLYVAGVTCFDAWMRPFAQSWLGFGIGYVNPVVEAEYLARHPLGPRLYNVFDDGGYLLWRLYPDYRVMTDSRSFPYLSWFDEQYAFANGSDVAGFVTRHPADAAVVDLDKTALVDRFLALPHWRLAFYGPTAAVFVPEGRAIPVPDADLVAARAADLRNGHTALRLFDFATRVGDLPTAWQVLAQLETRLRLQVPAADLERARAFRRAHVARPS